MPRDVATQLLRGTVPEIGANLVSFYGERGAGDWSHLELDLPVSKRRIIRRNCRFLYMGLQKLKGFSFSMGGGLRPLTGFLLLDSGGFKNGDGAAAPLDA